MRSKTTFLFLVWALVLGAMCPPLRAQTNNTLDFDGSNDIVNLPSGFISNFTGGRMTVEAWVYIDNYTEWGNVIINWGHESLLGGFMLGLNWNSPYIYATVRQTDGWSATATSPNVMPLDTWVHLAFVADGSHVILYENGVEVGRQVYNGTIYTGFPHTRIGAKSNDSGTGLHYPLDGMIDEVKVWNIARTPAEISNNRYTELIGNETGLVAYYKFNSGIGSGNNTGVTTLIDETGNFDGTLYNFALAGATSNWVANPTVTLSRSALTLNYCQGSASAVESFTLTGSDLQSNVTLTATGDFELSTDGTNYASSLALSPTSGSIASTTLYVRIPSSAATLPSGSISVTSTNMIAKTVTLSAENNNGLDFDGTNDYIAVPDNNAHDITGDLTMEAWLNPATTGSSQMVIGKLDYSGATSPYVCYTLRLFPDGKVKLEIGDGVNSSQSVVSNASIITGNWIHVAATFESATRIMRLYLDGVEVATTTAIFSTMRTTSRPMLIGSYDGGSFNNFGQYYKGKMDEVRIWNVVRTPAEIRANAHRRMQGDETGLVAYFPFNDGTGSTLTDASPTGVNGTLNNFALSGSTSNWTDVCGSIISLPVELKHFRANCAASGAQLDWATAMEENNAGFQVERSANGRDFEALGWVAGAGTTLATTHYTFTDDAPLSGVNYYRLAQMDYDGTTTYSPIATTVCKSSGKTFEASQVAIYPNPADAHLTIDLPLTGVESLAIRNVLGQEVYTQHSPQGQQRLDISKWERGLYFMTLTSDQEQFSFRFIVR